MTGDSYMAVTGVPKVDHDHHLTMAKFAWQCVKKMDLVTESLEAELGSDTKDLGVRVGMHSGPVTAGVLRGQKARYQLFGDTGKIQILAQMRGFCVLRRTTLNF